jgi:hypothetical protein
MRGRRRFLALYQGTTSVVPQLASHELGFSPCEIVIEVRKSAGAKEAAEKGRTEGEDRTLSG